MKLTIKNYGKLAGQWPDITITDVTETLQYYYFGCRRPNESTVHVVPLKRDGVNLYNYADVYYFVGPDGENSQGVTTDWFCDKANALSTVMDEFNKRYNYKK
jgi:hypothetical protein